MKAQEIKSEDAQENLSKIGGSAVSRGVVLKYDNRYEGIKGSAYYIDDWLHGSIILTDGNQAYVAEMRYNAYEDQLIIKMPNSGQYYFPKDKIKSFTLTDGQTGENFNFMVYQHFKRKADLQYYRIISQGKINIVEHIKIIFEKADFEGGYSNDKRYDEFKKYTDLYYYSASNPQPKKLKRTIKGIARITPEHSAEIRKFIIKNGYDCKNENDLIKIFGFIQNIE